MRLDELTGGNSKTAGIEILGLTADSRQIRPGYLFAAFSGIKTDGTKYIHQAVERGAVAVLTGPDVTLDTGLDNICRVTDVNPRRLFAKMVAKFYGEQPHHIAAVTGTNGKTSVATFTRQIWAALGHRAASIGTLGIEAPGLEGGPSLTTPDPVALHKSLHDMAENGVDHVAMEASSHGLSQYRLDGVRVETAAFTNLTRDHLDYHGTEEAYLYAKMRLFGEVMAPGGVAVLNRESPLYHEFENVCWARGHRVLSVGRVEGSIQMVASHPTATGQDLDVTYDGKIYSIKLPLAGDFQALNALTAAGLVIGCGADATRVFKALENLQPVRGRMQKVVQLPNGAVVFVDYAHTPDALTAVLRALRPHTVRELHVVFGCGGDRDRGKRPLMGDIATAHADRLYVTDDNPRSEDAAVIRREIMITCPDAAEIGDRRQAIEAAMHALVTGDVLVVAGKGHEDGQIVGDKVLPFNDVTVIEDVARKMGKGGGNDA